MKALVLTLRYSGMRTGDVVGLQKSHLKGDKLFLNTQKSGSKIYVPLPKVAAPAAVNGDSRPNGHAAVRRVSAVS